MRKLGMFIIVLAIAIFYGLFFCLAPFVANAIPAGDWQHFFQIIVYILIGWFGGVALPLSLLIWGIVIVIFTSGGSSRKSRR